MAVQCKQPQQPLLRLLWAPEETFEIQLGAEVLVNVAKIISPSVFCKLELDVKGLEAKVKLQDVEVASFQVAQVDGARQLYLGKAMSFQDVSWR